MNASDFIGGNAEVWVSGKTYASGKIVLSPADRMQPYVRITAAGSGATDPSADSTNYAAFGGRSIKSIQRGTIALGATDTSKAATITAVNTGKSVLQHLGSTTNNDVNNSDFVAIELTSSTAITASRNASLASSASVNWQLIEWF